MARHLSHDETIYIAGVFASASALKAVDTSAVTFVPYIWAYVENLGEFYFDPNVNGAETTDIIRPNNVADTSYGRWVKKKITSASSYALVKYLSTLGTGSTTTTKERVFYNFTMNGQANNTPGFMSKAGSNNAGVLPTTSLNDLGINNGAIDPYVIPFAGTIKSIRITLAQAAIGVAGPVASNVAIRFELYKMALSSRSSVANYDVPLNAVKVAVSNNLGTDNFQTAVLSNLSTPVAAGDLIGLQFTNKSGVNNFINAAGRIYAVLEIQES